MEHEPALVREQLETGCRVRPGRRGRCRRRRRAPRAAAPRSRDGREPKCAPPSFSQKPSRVRMSASPSPVESPARLPSATISMRTARRRRLVRRRSRSREEAHPEEVRGPGTRSRRPAHEVAEAIAVEIVPADGDEILRAGKGMFSMRSLEGAVAVVELQARLRDEVEVAVSFPVLHLVQEWLMPRPGGGTERRGSRPSPASTSIPRGRRPGARRRVQVRHLEPAAGVVAAGRVLPAGEREVRAARVLHPAEGRRDVVESPSASQSASTPSRLIRAAR